MSKRRESPVEIGDKVFVVDDRKFEIIETVVDSNPSEIIWAKVPKSKMPQAFGVHRWATTYAEAATKAVALINMSIQTMRSIIAKLELEKPSEKRDTRIAGLQKEIEGLQAQKRALKP